MNTAYLLLGGNQGNVNENLSKSIDLITLNAGKIVKKSSVYRTKAWGYTQQPDFLNQALHISTPLSPFELLDALLDIEKQIGRIRTNEKWTERTIDIDIIFYNDNIISEERLKIPHPFMQERKFVLIPLAEIAEKVIHPVFKKSVSELNYACTDSLDVILQKND